MDRDNCKKLRVKIKDWKRKFQALKTSCDSLRMEKRELGGTETGEIGGEETGSGKGEKGIQKNSKHDRTDPVPM